VHRDDPQSANRVPHAFPDRRRDVTERNDRSFHGESRLISEAEQQQCYVARSVFRQNRFSPAEILAGGRMIRLILSIALVAAMASLSSAVAGPFQDGPASTRLQPALRLPLYVSTARRGGSQRWHS